MRYTIGYSDINKVTGKICENRIYALTDYGLGFLLNPKNKIDSEEAGKTRIYVSDNIEEIKKLVTILSNCYRRDDVWLNSTKKSKLIRNFYPVKIDSSKFPYIVKKEKQRTVTVDGRKGEYSAIVDLHFLACSKDN